MPPIVGLEYTRAISALVCAGLGWTEERVVDPHLPTDDAEIVRAVRPAEGEIVRRGSTVAIEVTVRLLSTPPPALTVTCAVLTP